MTDVTARPSRPEMFMGMAYLAAMRSTCRRNTVGAVITDVEGLSVVSIGYNGNAKGFRNTCDATTPGSCGCIHAETNALIKAPFHQGPLALYATVAPCASCAKLIINSAVRAVYYSTVYREPLGIRLLETAGIISLCIPNITASIQYHAAF